MALSGGTGPVSRAHVALVLTQIKAATRWRTRRQDASASAAAHEVRRVGVARLDFPLLRSKKEWDSGSVPSALAAVQKEIAWADRLVLIFPAPMRSDRSGLWPIWRA